MIILPVLHFATIAWAVRHSPPAGATSGRQPAAGSPPGVGGQGQLALIGRDGKPAGDCPLQRTSVTADIAGFVARVNVEQQFRNPALLELDFVRLLDVPRFTTGGT